MNKIVNLHQSPAAPYIYVGRSPEGWINADFKFGCPFKFADKTPEEIAKSLGLYRAWLKSKIESGDKWIMSLMREINEDTVLACHCVNLTGDEIYDSAEKCHAQVIFKAWKWAKSAGLI